MDEVVALSLKLSKQKQDELSATFAELRSRASSTWKDLEDRLDSTRGSLEDLSERLAEREDNVVSRERQLEAKESRSKAELEENKQDLEAIQILLLQKLEELEEKETLCDAVKSSLREKQAELGRVEDSLSKGTEKLGALEKSLRERSVELGSVRDQLSKFEAVASLKEENLNKIQRDFDKRSQEFQKLRSSIDECERATKAQEEKLGAVRRELELKEKRLRLVERLTETMRKQMDQCSLEFGVKEKKIESLLGRIEEVDLKSKLRRSEIEDVGSIRKRVDKWLEEIDRNEKSFASLENPVRDLFRELKTREAQLERNVREFDSRVAKSGSKTIKTEPREHDQTPLCPAIRNVENASECIQKLIQRGEIIHAVGHILELKLTHKFSPVNLLKDYLEDSKSYTEMVLEGNNPHEVKRKAVTKEIGAVRAAIECLKVTGLEAKFPISYEELANRVAVLEEMVRHPKRRVTRIPFVSPADSLRIKIKYPRLSDPTNETS